MSTREKLTEFAIALLGVALIAGAIAANQRWLDRHLLSDFFIARATFVRVETNTRIAAAAIGLVLVFLLRRPLARFLVRDPLRSALLACAIVASFGAAELVLRTKHLRAKEEVLARKEPRRHLDARLGWLFVPSRSGYQTINGRRTEYAFDANGYRVRRTGDVVDFHAPTIVFTGESMMVGEKLHWDETIPAQTAALTGLQSANIAVSGFATDQAFLHLQHELPRFRHPVATVLLFTPSLFDRNLDDDRPHLGSHLAWLPAKQRWRLAAIAKRLLRYRSEEDIERGIEVTREVLRAYVDLSRAHGAQPLILVPQFGDEEPREREWRRRILDEPRFPYVQVKLDPTWRIYDDGHPDPRAAHAMAVALAQRLAAPRVAQAFQPAPRGRVRLELFMQRFAPHENAGPSPLRAHPRLQSRAGSASDSRHAGSSE
jgi:hypothetical protein